MIHIIIEKKDSQCVYIYVLRLYNAKHIKHAVLYKYSYHFKLGIIELKTFFQSRASTVYKRQTQLFHVTGFHP